MRGTVARSPRSVLLGTGLVGATLALACGKDGGPRDTEAPEGGGGQIEVPSSGGDSTTGGRGGTGGAAPGCELGSYWDGQDCIGACEVFELACPVPSSGAAGASGVVQCVDPGSDSAHCGGCDRECPAEASCDEGACLCDGVPCCAMGEASCEGECVDLWSDPAHCGSCGTACGEGQTCHQGSCAECSERPFLETIAYDVGSAAAPTYYQVASHPAALDVDRDGRMDLLALTPGDSKLNVIRQTDSGYEEPQSLATAEGAQVLATGDLDGDGYQDVVTLGLSTLALHFGNGRGWFDGPYLVQLSPQGPTTRGVDLEIADYDGDDVVELVVLVSPNTSFNDPAQVLLFDVSDKRQEYFLAETLLNEELSEPLSSLIYEPRLQVVDVDADENLDVLLFHREVIAFLGDGTGVFVRQDNYAESDDDLDHPLKFVDQDGDGDLDLLSARVTGQGTLISGFYLGVARPQPGGGFERLPFDGPVAGDFREPNVTFIHANDDKFLDAVVRSEGYVYVYLGSEAGFVDDPVRSPLGGETDHGMLLADLSGDERAELISLTDGLLLIAELDADLTFDTHFVPLPPQTYTRDVGVLVDPASPPRVVVVGGVTEGEFRVLSLEEDGSFAVDEAHPISRPRNLALGDVTGEGAVDALVAATGRLVWLQRQDDGSFSSPETIEYLDGLLEVSVGELTGEGPDEIVLTNRSRALDEVVVYQWDSGAGEFVAHRQDVPDLLLAGLADIDGDGASEILVAAGEIVAGTSRVTVYSFLEGVLEEKEARDVLGLTSSIEALDGDGDGRDDVLVGVAAEGYDLLRLNSGGTLETVTSRSTPTISSFGMAIDASALSVGGVGQRWIEPSGGRFGVWEVGAEGRLILRDTYLAPGGWSVRGIEDFTGDGLADLLVSGGSSYDQTLALLRGAAVCE